MTRIEIKFFSTLAGVVGLLYLVIPARYLAFVYFPVVAIGFILMGVVKLVILDTLLKDREFYYNLIEGLLAIIIGVIYFNFYEYLLIDIFSFIILSIIPILRLISAKHIFNQVIFDSLKYIGLFSLLGGYIAINSIFFYFCSILWFVLYFYICYIGIFPKARKEKIYEED